MINVINFRHIKGAFSISVILLLSGTFAVSAQEKITGEEGLYMEGLKEYNVGSADKALSIFSSLARKGSRNDAVYYYLSNIYSSKNKPDSARAMMERAVRLDPGNTWYSTQLASLYLNNEQTEDAIKIYESLHKSNPQQVDLYDGLIDIYIKQKKLDQALDVLEDIEKYAGKSEASCLTRYNLFIFQNKKDEAIKYLIGFDKENGTPRTATILGDYYSSVKEDSLAMEYYSKAISIEPSYVPAIFGQAELHRIKSRFKPYFRSMIPLMANPVVTSEMKVEYLSQIISNQRFVETFLPQVDTLVSNMYYAHPGDSSTTYLYARYMAQTGRVELASEALEENLKYFGESRAAHREYLSILYYMEDWDKIISHIEKYPLMFAYDPGLLEIKGLAYVQKEMIPEAIDVFKNVLYIAKGDSAMEVRALSVLGDLSYQVGNRKNAYKYYRKTIKKAPTYNPVLNNYAYYLSLEGKQLEKAYKMSKKTIDSEPDNPTYLDTFAWILHLMGKDLEAKAIIKHALVYGGNESAAILDHYAEILYKLKELDLAFRYWDQADKIDTSLGIAEKVKQIKEGKRK
ncbi:MAG: tetratricopeptide repeat protein [Rikenellaceae bacterium]|nr:tetratricopeptide repeat protein [Rikenellaceae bacterium]